MRGRSVVCCVCWKRHRQPDAHPAQQARSKATLFRNRKCVRVFQHDGDIGIVCFHDQAHTTLLVCLLSARRKRLERAVKVHKLAKRVTTFSKRARAEIFWLSLVCHLRTSLREGGAALSRRFSKTTRSAKRFIYGWLAWTMYQRQQIRWTEGDRGKQNFWLSYQFSTIKHSNGPFAEILIPKNVPGPQRTRRNFRSEWNASQFRRFFRPTSASLLRYWESILTATVVSFRP